MNTPANKPQDLQAKVHHGLVEYAFDVVHLSLVFASFISYRRLVLASYDISYTHCFVPLIEALVMRKIIMIGGVLHLGRGFEDRPLICPTLCRAVVFTVFVGLFGVIEHVVVGLWHGGGLTAGLAGYAAKGRHEILANSLIVTVAFFPFLAVKELGRVLGRERISALFFRAGSDASARPGGKA